MIEISAPITVKRTVIVAPLVPGQYLRNYQTLLKFAEADGQPTFDGQPFGGGPAQDSYTKTEIDQLLLAVLAGVQYISIGNGKKLSFTLDADGALQFDVTDI